MYDVIMNGEVRRAISGPASKLWVPGRAGMHGRPLPSFCPKFLSHNSAATHFFSMVSM